MSNSDASCYPEKKSDQKPMDGKTSPDISRKLFRSTYIVSAMTMLSRILGFVRDIVLAQTFGAGAGFDAFVVAFKLPNFMRRLFGEGAFSQAFVPIMAEYREKKSPEELQQFINHIAGTLGLVLMLVVVVGELLAPVIIIIFAPGFLWHDPIRYHLATHMLRITFPYLFLIALTAFAGAMLNTCGRFAIPAFTPVLLNVAMISVAWLWAPHASKPIYTLAWGVVIGGVLQLALQFPFLKKYNVLPRPSIAWKDPGVRRVLKLMVPALFGVSVYQLSLLIDNFFASFLPEGSISWLYYSDRLTYLPLGIIGVALATVVLPYLARHHSNNNQQSYSQTVDWALRCAIVVGLPAAVGLFFLAGPLLATLIQHGVFDEYDVMMTRESLMAFAIGLPSFMSVKILASAYYSRQNIKTPVKVAAVAMACNLVFNVALIFPLKHAGIALATSLASWVNSFALLWLLLKRDIFKPNTKWWLLLLRVVFANMLMAILVWWLAGNTQRWFAWHELERILHLLMIIGAAILGYVITLFATGLRMHDFHPPS